MENINQMIRAIQVQQGMTFVRVQFWQDGEYAGKTYVYATTQELAVGDIVLVEARDHIQVACVHSDFVEVDWSTIQCRWVVGCLNDMVADHKEMLERERNVRNRS